MKLFVVAEKLSSGFMEWKKGDAQQIPVCVCLFLTEFYSIWDVLIVNALFETCMSIVQ